MCLLYGPFFVIIFHRFVLCIYISIILAPTRTHTPTFVFFFCLNKLPSIFFSFFFLCPRIRTLTSHEMIKPLRC
uniref:Uncharacterized protein n=1 Tax=Rhizophora mucronata TaxID=61149 RepID=A0A2P2IZS4_RHIMU